MTKRKTSTKASKAENAESAAKYLDTIIEGNSLDALKQLPDECVDLVFADPPYNLQLDGELKRPNNSQVKGVDDAWDKFDSFKAYDDFTREWMSECKRV